MENKESWEERVEALAWPIGDADKPEECMSELIAFIRSLIADEREAAVAEYQLKTMGK